MDEFEKTNETSKNEEIIESAEIGAETEGEELPNGTTNEALSGETVDAEATDSVESYEYEAPLITVSDEQSQDISAQAASKKPFILERTIIKAACVFLAALVVFGCFAVISGIMNPGLEGVWMLNKVYIKGNEAQAQTVGKDAKEATYYQLTSDGDFIYTSGTVTQKTKWSYSDDKGNSVSDKTDSFIMYPESNKMYATQFNWKCEGNAFSEKKLILETGSDDVTVYELTSYGGDLPEYKMSASKDFKAVKDIIGKWNDETSQQKLTFKEDGSYVLDVGGYLTQTGNYTVDTDKKTLKLSFVNGGVKSDTGDLPYSISKGKLTLADYEFTKE